jgi:hypothetical protein
MSAGMQADIVTSRSRQPRSLTTRRSAGNHASAWLSPYSAIVVCEARWPYRQDLLGILPPCDT